VLACSAVAISAFLLRRQSSSNNAATSSVEPLTVAVATTLEKDSPKNTTSIQNALRLAINKAKLKPPYLNNGGFEIMVKGNEERFSFLFLFENPNTNDLHVTVEKQNGDVSSMQIY